MSKQSEAREEQGYKDEGPRCGTCCHFLSDSVPITWMVKMNNERIKAGFKPHYDLTLPEHTREANLRCGIGKFAVKKNAHCNHYEDGNE